MYVFEYVFKASFTAVSIKFYSSLSLFIFFCSKWCYKLKTSEVGKGYSHFPGAPWLGAAHCLPQSVWSPEKHWWFCLGLSLPGCWRHVALPINVGVHAGRRLIL